MNKVKLVGSIILVWLTTNAQAFIYEATIMRTWNKRQGRYQYVVGLGDFHDKQHPANQLQLELLKDLYARCPNARTSIILEDISSANSNGCQGCGKFSIDSRGGILGGLAQLSRRAGLDDIHNVEYRYCRVAALGPILNNEGMPVDKIPSCNAITIGALMHEINTTLDEISLYNDLDHLNDWYKQKAEQIRVALGKLNFSSFLQAPIAHYFTAMQATIPDRNELLKTLLTFDSVLLDIKMIHLICTKQDKENLIIVAGGSHIEQVNAVLETLGYERVYATKTSMEHEYDIRKCIGCRMISDSCCIKPKPIDLRILLDNFL